MGRAQQGKGRRKERDRVISARPPARPRRTESGQQPHKDESVVFGNISDSAYENLDLLQLRREIKRLKAERDLLLIACARFAKETSRLETASIKPPDSSTGRETDDLAAWLHGLT